VNKKQREIFAKRLHKRIDERAKKEGISSWRLLHCNPLPEMKGRGINLATLKRKGEA
jgi:hypothetical protein